MIKIKIEVKDLYGYFYFDYEYTRKFSIESEYRCDCDNCLNFYNKFKYKYPRVNELLESFGLNNEYALEIMDLDCDSKDNLREYMVYYVVKGKAKYEYLSFTLEGLEINFISNTIEETFWPSPDIKEPYFIIEIINIYL